MRKYRGLTKDDKWVYGWYALEPTKGAVILADIGDWYDGSHLTEIEVIPETVGQQTGLKDKKRTEEYPKGQEIYEGDVVTIGCYALRAVITYEHCSFRMFHVSGSKRRKYCGDGRSELIFHNCDISTEVIGDIHTTPQLLEKQ